MQQNSVVSHLMTLFICYPNRLGWQRSVQTMLLMMLAYIKTEENTLQTKIHSIYQSFSVNVKSLCRIYFLVYGEINLQCII